MKTNLTARNLDLSDGLRSQVERKLRRLDRITHEEAEAEVELIANASHATDTAHVAEVTLVNNGSVLRSSSAGATPMAAPPRKIGFMSFRLRSKRPVQLHGVK